MSKITQNIWTKFLFGTSICSSIVNATEISDKEREVRIDILEKSWKICTDMNFKFNKIKPEFAQLKTKRYENSIYDIIGQLIGKTVYGTKLDKKRKMITDNIFIKRATNPMQYTTNNWTWTLLANLLDKTLVKYGDTKPKIKEKIYNIEVLEKLVTDIKDEFLKSGLFFAKKDNKSLYKEISQKLNKASYDLLKYAEATSLGLYVMMQNMCTRKMLEEEGYCRIAPMIDILRQPKQSKTYRYVAYINTLENIEIVRQYANKIKTQDPDLYKLININKNDSLIKDSATILFYLNKQQDLQNIISSADNTIKTKLDIRQYIDIYQQIKNNNKFHSLTSEINERLKKEEEYYAKYKQYSEDYEIIQDKVKQWFDLLGITNKEYRNVYYFEIITRGQEKDYKITQVNKDMAKYSDKFERYYTKEKIIEDIMQKLNRNNEYYTSN